MLQPWLANGAGGMLWWCIIYNWKFLIYVGFGCPPAQPSLLHSALGTSRWSLQTAEPRYPLHWWVNTAQLKVQLFHTCLICLFSNQRLMLIPDQINIYCTHACILFRNKDSTVLGYFRVLKHAILKCLNRVTFRLCYKLQYIYW